MLVLRHIAICAAVGLWSTSLFGLSGGFLLAQQPDPPAIASLSPLALAPDDTSELQITGENLAEAVSVWTSSAPLERFPAKAISAKAASFRFNPSSKPPVGIYGLRLITTAGVSNLRLFMVDDLPSVTLSGQHKSPQTALEVELPAAAESFCSAESSRYFSFRAKAGQRVSMEVFARRLASPLDPVIRVLDAEGRELAYADDEPGMMGDCRLAFQAPETGRFLIELRDIRYAGGKNFTFRLRMGDFPLASVCYPPVVQRGTSVEVQPCVVAGSEVGSVQISVPADYAQSEFNFGSKSQLAGEEKSDQAGSALLKVLTSDKIQTVEQEPNDEPTTATVLDMLEGVSGRFQTLNDPDWYQITAQQGDHLQIQARSKRFLSPAEVVLKIYDMNGELLAESNPALQEEPRLEYAVPTSGQYRILVQELQRQGGEAFVYHLSLQKTEPGYSLKLDRTRLNPPTQGVFELPVSVNRTHYQGEIILSLPDLPAGCELTGTVVPAEKNETTIQVQLPSGLGSGTLLFTKVIGHSAGETEIQPVNAALLEPVRDDLQWNVWPPVDLNSKLAIGVGPAFPKFLKLTMQPDKVVLPQLVGTSSFQIKAERLHDFQEAIELKLLGLPPEIQAKGVTLEKGQNERKVELSGGEKLPLGETPFQITTRVSMKGQPQTVQLEGVLQVIPPLRITLLLPGALPREGKQKLVMKAERFGKESHPIQVKLENLPNGISAPADIMLPAGVNTIQVDLTAALTVEPGKYPDLQATAVTKYGDSEVTAHSTPTTLEVVEAKGAGNGK